MILLYIYIYLDLRKDTNKCPFPRFLPLGRISCEGAGNGHFLIIVVNFGFRAFWADLTLLCVKMCRFFWAEIPGKKDEKGGNTREKGGNTRADSSWLKNENMKWHVFSWNGHFYIEMGKFPKNGQKSNQNLPWKEICNQWISRYIYKSRVEVVFGMSVENFTSELLKTWSLHSGGV